MTLFELFEKNPDIRLGHPSGVGELIKSFLEKETEVTETLLDPMLIRRLSRSNYKLAIPRESFFSYALEYPLRQIRKLRYFLFDVHGGSSRHNIKSLI